MLRREFRVIVVEYTVRCDPNDSVGVDVSVLTSQMCNDAVEWVLFKPELSDIRSRGLLCAMVDA